MKKKMVLLNKHGNLTALCEKYHITEPMARILLNRSIEDLHGYLSDGGSLRDGRLLKGMDETVFILKTKIAEKKSIRIFGDMDVDGITATTILLLAIRQLGGTVSYDIPHRVVDGYGANVRMVEEAYHDGVDTILTVDNGIAAFDAVSRAKELGMTVVITDHHEVQVKEGVQILPQADAIVDPKQSGCSYPFPGICGAMIAFKIAELLLETPFGNANIDPLVELAALGTVCDVMELMDENRTIVKRGISLMQHSSFSGIRALMKINSINPEKLSTYHMGFIIGPSLNSTGRLDTAKRGVEFLLEQDEKRAEEIALEIKNLNDERKQMTIIAQQTAESLTASMENDKVYILYLPDCHESIAGIVAGRIKETHYHPTIVLTDGGDGILKGSARSIPGYNMFAELTQHKNLLLKFGGHTMAAGLSLPKENLETLRQALNQSCTLTEGAFNPPLYLDLYLPIHLLNDSFISELSMMEPFGVGNPKPVIADKGLSIVRAVVIGTNSNMLKFTLRSTRGVTMKALYFGDKEKFDQDVRERYGESSLDAMYHGRPSDIRLLLTYSPCINEWNGTKSIELIINEYDFC